MDEESELGAVVNVADISPQLRPTEDRVLDVTVVVGATLIKALGLENHGEEGVCSGLVVDLDVAEGVLVYLLTGAFGDLQVLQFGEVDGEDFFGLVHEREVHLVYAEDGDCTRLPISPQLLHQTHFLRSFLLLRDFYETCAPLITNFDHFRRPLDINAEENSDWIPSPLEL